MIETRGLTKSFTSRQGREKKTVEAVRGVDLSVAGGEIYGFLGPNGAGKTTTLRMLATLITPDGGTATIAGADLRGDPAAVRRRIGYVAQGGSTWDDSTAREELVLQARLYRMSKADATARTARVLDAFQLSEYADRKCKTYSGGQRRRVDIALGIIHEPKIVFLDEPTSGLDPQSRAHMWDEIRRLRAEGMTVFITTHYLDEADALCDRIAIMDHGRIVAAGTPDELKRDTSGDALQIGLGAAAPAVATRLEGTPAVLKIEKLGDSLRVYVTDPAIAIPSVLRLLDTMDVTLTSFELLRPSLDDVFLTQTGRSLRES
jgi:ABC-2 type transport system ATP-binding protein